MVNDIKVKQSTTVRSVLQSYLYVGEMAVNNNNNNNNNNEHALYSNGICFLSNDDFDFMVAAKHDAEEAIGWKLLPENVIYRVEKMSPVQTKWGSRFIVLLRNAMGKTLMVCVTMCTDSTGASVKLHLNQFNKTYRVVLRNM